MKRKKRRKYILRWPWPHKQKHVLSSLNPRWKKKKFKKIIKIIQHVGFPGEYDIAVKGKEEGGGKEKT
jgi:hypothetical protein